MINFDTSNLIIVAYPAGAGGKFLMNSLGLSTKAVLQDATLAEEDVNGNLSSLDKLNILKSRMPSGKWNDLGLGCMELFGVHQTMYDHHSYEECCNFKFNSAIDTISNSDKLFFVAENRIYKPCIYLKLWPNAKIIAFDNSEKFVRERNRLPGLEHIDKLTQYFIGDKPWPTRLIAETDLRWDTNNYYSLDATLAGVKDFYQRLELPDYNRDYVAEYYNLWIKTING